MTLSVYKSNESASRTHENEFFGEFASHLKWMFEDRGYDGILIGFPISKSEKYFMPDCLLLTKNVALIIDFKDYSGIIVLPGQDDWNTDEWRQEQTNVAVKGGSSKNPFIQVQKQSYSLKRITEKVNEKFENGRCCVLFHGDDVSFSGSVPKLYKKWFSITSKQTYLTDIENIISVRASFNSELNYEALISEFEVKVFSELIPIDLKEAEKLRVELDSANKKVKDKETDLKIATEKRKSEEAKAKQERARAAREKEKTQQVKMSEHNRIESFSETSQKNIETEAKSKKGVTALVIAVIVLAITGAILWHFITTNIPPENSTAELSNTTTPVSCNIKGNVNPDSGEKIYHMPGQKYYDSTQIDSKYGEKMFCSEAEAQAAGWRKSLV